MTADVPIFVRSFDFLTWLLPATKHIPAEHQATFTPRLVNAAFDLREHLESANHRSGKTRMNLLRLADEDLDRVRLYLKLALQWQWLPEEEYNHAISLVTEIGKLLGGWQKATAYATQ